MDIPRFTPKEGAATPASVPCWERGGSFSKAFVWCGRGHIATLEEHSVADDGTVSPSLVCPREGCGWHECVRLVDWNP